jgi:uncharacterized MAPEG superfamily protein
MTAELVAPTPLERREKTKKAVVVGWSSFLVCYPAALWLWPQWGPAVDDRFAVLEFALKLLFFVGALVAIIAGSLMRLQDTPEAEDVFAGLESQKFKLGQRALTNTVEQAWSFVPMWLALCMVVDQAHLYLVSLHLVLWVFARLVFWRGYVIDMHLRAPGMDWTLGLNFSLLFWVVKLWFFG